MPSNVYLVRSLTSFTPSVYLHHSSHALPSNLGAQVGTVTPWARPNPPLRRSSFIFAFLPTRTTSPTSSEPINHCGRSDHTRPWREQSQHVRLPERVARSYPRHSWACHTPKLALAIPEAFRSAVANRRRRHGSGVVQYITSSRSHS